jgi:hypothetical protein
MGKMKDGLLKKPEGQGDIWQHPMDVEDAINPPHYREHPSGVEAIQITEHMGFCLGNAMKYIWRADLKHGDGGVEDLTKAKWYLERELKRRGQDESTN